MFLELILELIDRRICIISLPYLKGYTYTQIAKTLLGVKLYNYSTYPHEPLQTQHDPPTTGRGKGLPQ